MWHPNAFVTICDKMLDATLRFCEADTASQNMVEISRPRFDIVKISRLIRIQIKNKTRKTRQKGLQNIQRSDVIIATLEGI